MSIFKQNREFYNTPFRLTEKQRQNPIKVIEQFFSFVDLAESREDIANLLHTALISNNFYFDDGQKRSNAIFFCRQLEKLIEAAYLLHPKHKKPKKKKK